MKLNPQHPHVSTRKETIEDLSIWTQIYESINCVKCGKSIGDAALCIHHAYFEWKGLEVFPFKTRFTTLDKHSTSNRHNKLGAVVKRLVSWIPTCTVDVIKGLISTMTNVKSVLSQFTCFPGRPLSYQMVYMCNYKRGSELEFHLLI